MKLVFKLYNVRDQCKSVIIRIGFCTRRLLWHTEQTSKYCSLTMDFKGSSQVDQGSYLITNTYLTNIWILKRYRYFSTFLPLPVWVWYFTVVFYKMITYRLLEIYYLLRQDEILRITFGNRSTPTPFKTRKKDITKSNECPGLNG